MKQINYIKSIQGCDILTTDCTNYDGSSKIYIKCFIDKSLKSGNYTFIDLHGVFVDNFVKFALSSVEAIRNNNLSIENIILFSPFESHSYRYYNFMFSVFALNGTKNILLLDAGIGTTDTYIEHCFDNLTVTQKYLGYFTYYYFDNKLLLPQQDISTIEKNKYFCSLARCARYERIKFTNKLLSNQSILKKGLISCAWEPYDTDTQRWHTHHDLILSLIPADLRACYPVLIDNHKPDQYEIEHKLVECAINVVLTGDVGISAHSYSFKHRTKRSMLNELNERSPLDEKTVKMFLSFQLPIFLAAPGYVQDLRLLGFDVFDDFINHSYDKIDDLDIRIEMVYSELARLCNLELYTIIEYIEINKNRMYCNVGKLPNFSHSCIVDIQNHINDNFLQP